VPFHAVEYAHAAIQIILPTDAQKAPLRLSWRNSPSLSRKAPQAGETTIVLTMDPAEIRRIKISP